MTDAARPSPPSYTPEFVRYDNNTWTLPCAIPPFYRLSTHVSRNIDSPDHFFVPVTLNFPNIKPIKTFALLDSGATTSCISDKFAIRHNLPRARKDNPVPIVAVDDRPIASGFITQDIITSLQVKGHQECIRLAVVSVHYPVILGLDWLQRHNPSVDWARKKLTLTCCGLQNIVTSGRGSGSELTLPNSLNVTSIGLGLRLNPMSFASTVIDSHPVTPTHYPNAVPAIHAIINHNSIIGNGLRRTKFFPSASIETLDDSPDVSPSNSQEPLNSSPPATISFLTTKRFYKQAKGRDVYSFRYYDNRELATLEARRARLASFGPADSNTQDPNTANTQEPHLRHTDTSTDPVTRQSRDSSSPEAEDDAAPKQETLASLPSKYHAYSDVFSAIDVDNLPPHRPYDCSIELEENKSPPFGPIYGLSETERKALHEYVESNLAKGFIRRSTSAAGAPILFIKKKTGDLRLCVDYRGLNAVTKKNRYPLPLTDELLDRVRGCTVFSVIDLKNAFNLIRIREGDEWKTAFRTHLGLFEYLVMPFGLTNAPATFQAFIQDTLRDLLDIICVVYLDDILIFSRNQEEHDAHVKLVLDRLRAAKLYANPKKCVFDQDEVEYLGYILGKDGLKMNPKKLSTIVDWPEPRSVKDIQSFLGFANFYRRFVEHYAQIVIPLHAHTRKDAPLPFRLSDEARQAFNQLKRIFTSAPVLRHFDPALPITLITDASDFAISGIVHQPDHNNQLHPVAFFSRKLSPAEINYDVYNKEMLAIIESFREFRPWLIGTSTPLSVISDHKNLEYFMSTRILNRRQARWSIFLSEFNFRLDYLPGSRNPADAPSRRPDYVLSEGEDTVLQQRKALLTEKHTERLYATNSTAETISAIATFTFPAPELKNEFTNAYHSDTQWREAISNGDSTFTVEDNLVFHNGRLFVPETLRSLVLKMRHDHLVAGHPGRARTIALVQRDYSWPSMSAYIRKYVSSCETCARIKTPRHKPYGLLQPLEIPSRPWSSISMDFIVKLPTSHGCDSIWVVCDRLTRAAHFIPCVETLRAPELAWLFLDRIFKYHGLPESIISDRGSLFVSKFWSELCKQLQITPRTSTAYHPRTNGLTERTNQTLETYLRAYVSYQQDDWVDYLPLAEFSFNNLPNASTQQSPFYANYGFHPTFEPRLSADNTNPEAGELAKRLSIIHEELKAELSEAQNRQAIQFNKHATPSPEFKAGDLVWLLRRNIRTTRPSDKLDYRRLGPFEILYKVGSSACRLKLPPKLSRLFPVFHVSLLEPYSDPSWVPGRASLRSQDINLEDSDSEDSISAILDTRKLGRRYDYLVSWTGKPESENSWIPLSELPHSLDETLIKFHRRHPKLPRPIRFDTQVALPSLSIPFPISGSQLPLELTDPTPQPFTIQRSPSPPPVKPRNLYYQAPPQTTLRTGRVSRPRPRPDDSQSLGARP